VPWLEPDISDCLADLAAGGSRSVVVIPIGFVSDHMEVIYDLDTEAAQTARRLGLPMARAATPGSEPRFVSMITSLTAQCAAGGLAQVAADLGPDVAAFCSPGCCASPAGAGLPPPPRA
jgi:protoporphyrin/coproporphyrin ferrochelatase